MTSEPADKYIVPMILSLIEKLPQEKGKTTLLDVGCGDGYAADQFRQAGYPVRAFDASTSDIDLARQRYPGISYEVHSVYDENLVNLYGSETDCITSLEVVEHLYYPRQLFQQSFRLLRKGGWLILSTPYHGYWKNLALSVMNGWDNHFKVDWDGGHIKFFSNEALVKMATETGFQNPTFFGVGRIPYLWKSTILIVQK